LLTLSIRLDVALESARGSDCAELTECINHDRCRIHTCCYAEMFPMKHVSLTFAPATLPPIQITLLAVVTLAAVFAPKATLPPPVPLNASARLPTAVLLSPAVLFIRAL